MREMATRAVGLAALTGLFVLGGCGGDGLENLEGGTAESATVEQDGSEDGVGTATSEGGPLTPPSLTPLQPEILAGPPLGYVAELEALLREVVGPFDGAGTWRGRAGGRSDAAVALRAVPAEVNGADFNLVVGTVTDLASDEEHTLLGVGTNELSSLTEFAGEEVVGLWSIVLSDGLLVGEILDPPGSDPGPLASTLGRQVFRMEAEPATLEPPTVELVGPRAGSYRYRTGVDGPTGELDISDANGQWTLAIRSSDDRSSGLVEFYSGVATLDAQRLVFAPGGQGECAISVQFVDVGGETVAGLQPDTNDSCEELSAARQAAIGAYVSVLAP